MRAACLIVLLLVAGCSRGERQQPANDAAASGFVPPPMATPTPLVGQAHAMPLTGYVGKYPTDIVNGVSFYDRQEVGVGLERAVGDQQVRQAIMERTSVSAPIFRDEDGRVAAWGCEQHNCGDHNWTIFIADRPARSIACYHDARTMGDSSHWYAGAAPVTRPGGCPSDASNETGA